MIRVTHVVAAAIVFAASAPAEAQNAIAPGPLNLKSTFDNIGVRAPFSGDANQNATAAVRFKRTAESTWHTAFTPIVDRRATIAGHANPYVNEARVSIVGLQSGTSYNVELTWSDPDGATTSNVVTGTISTLNTVALTTQELWVDAAAGSSGNGSQASPFNAITTAIAAASPGTKIRVKPGSYPPVTISKSGSAAGGYIAIVGEDRDTTFITGGSSVTNNITVGSGVSYVQFKSLRLKPTASSSVTVGSNDHHVWLEDLYHENIMGASTSCSTSLYDAAGVYFSNGTHENFVINNQIYSAYATSCQVPGSAWDQNADGIDMYGTDPTGGFVVKGNIINGGFRDCIGNGGESWGDGFRDNSDILNNTVTGCKDDGIQMEGEDVNLRIGGNHVLATGSGHSDGSSCLAMAVHLVGPVYVYRNTLSKTSSYSGYIVKSEDSPGYGFYIHNSFNTTGGGASDGWGWGASAPRPFDFAYNNIIVFNEFGQDGSSSTGAWDYNLYFRSGGGSPYIGDWNGSTSYATVADFRSGTGNEVHGKQADPLFLNSNMSIGTNSPAYDAGVVIPNFNSLDSAWPYAGSAPDIGAFEVGGATVTQPPPASPTNLRIVP